MTDGAKKRILIFSTAFLPLVGGAEVAVKEITDRLVDFEFVLITARLRADLPKIEQVGRIEVHRLGWGIFLDKILLAFYGDIYARKLQRQKPFVACWAVMASFGGLAAQAFKQKYKNLPLLLTLQEGDDLTEIERKMKPVNHLFRRLFRSADRVQVISSYLAAWAKQMGVRAPILVVPNGVDSIKYKVVSSKYGEKENTEEKIIITTSRLVKKNGVADLIKALEFLPNNFKLWILGVGSEEKDLRQLSAKLNLIERVKFIGLVPPAEVSSYLASADVFVRASLSEGLGNSFLEAMAVGVPIVGTKVGGIPDFLQDGETGWFCVVNNPTSIAEKVKFITDPANQEKISEVKNRARALVEKDYDWAKIAERMKQIFQELL